MDLEERLSYLENVRDWQSLVEELEKGIGSPVPNGAKAQFHLKLGRLLEAKFLAGVKALKHFQDAYKLNPALTESLESARNIYWDLGKLNMVQKLLELELKAAADGPRASALLVDLGDVLSDQGDWEKAAATYARALGSSGGKNAEASACLADAQLDKGTWKSHLAGLLESAENAPTDAQRSRLLLRAARVARRFSPAEAEGLLARAYIADATNKQVAALYEALLAEQGRLGTLEQTQTQILQQQQDRSGRGRLALIFGTRWGLRHQNVEIGARMLEEALRLNPDNEGAFFFLREVYGKKGGDWDRVLTLAEEVATRAEDVNVTFLLAQAGTIAWRQLGNLIRARLSFERLSAFAPDHPQLRAFEAQIGETLQAVRPAVRSRDRIDGVGAVPEPLPSAEVPTPPAPPALAGILLPLSSPAVDAAPPPSSEPEPPIQEVLTGVPPSTEAAAPVLVGRPPVVPADVVAPSAVAPTGAAPAAAESPAPPPVAPAAVATLAEPVLASMSSDVDAAKIAELRALADKQESSKRYNEFVKTLLQLAALVPERGEKVSLYGKAADLYVSKFANQAEAVKAYEAVLAIDPDNTLAVEYLRQMYEKRRDWEKLLGLQRREAELLPRGAGRARKFLEIAKLATERVKKPDVCIDLWQEVLSNDESNSEALSALAGLYERAKDFERLAAVLERQADATVDAGAKIQVLTKLGTICGDRLGNDEGAVNAWRTLLTLDPSDRRAQDALKKKYLALGRWDDLEIFYAESGKWDEFIRVLEQQESKETNAPAKISLLLR